MSRFELRSSDLLLITLDALRLDVAERALGEGLTPFLAGLIGGSWEARHTPGNFTYAAHAAFFAGFWPTPTTPGPHPRPFALRFSGSRTIDAETCVLDGENIVAGLMTCGYRTVCIGGVGYFNRLNPLGCVFPDMFEVSLWSPEFSVGEFHSTREQVRAAVSQIENSPMDRPLFLFLNVSATHAPTRRYVPGAKSESIETQMAALAYVDRQLPPLFNALRRRARAGSGFVMSDHGPLFGEEGHCGHRVSHPSVWTVPYAECSWEANNDRSDD